MRFEESIDVQAAQQRVWDILSDLEGWPSRIETVDTVSILTPEPLAEGSRVRLRQPRLPEGTWEISVWDPPTYFEWRQKAGGVTSIAGHRVDAEDEDHSRLTLTLDMRGPLIPIVGLFYRGLTNRYMSLEARSIKDAAEATER